MGQNLMERYRDRLHGVLSCYDRIVVTGTLPQACYAAGMTAFLNIHGIRILKPDSGKCLHYYFYFMDAQVGLCYLRVLTWSAFRLQFYCNGHGWLARGLTRERIGFRLADNAFVRVDDWERAQALADGLKPKELHRVLDRYAKLCCPVQETFGQRRSQSALSKISTSSRPLLPHAGRLRKSA